MTITRRFFLSSSCGAIIAVASSGMLINQIFGNPQGAQHSLTTILQQRFPKLHIPDEVMQQFSAMLCQLDVHKVGAAGVSMADAYNPNVRSINLQRYVVREFIMNTNYFEHKQEKFKGLRFQAFRQAQA